MNTEQQSAHYIVEPYGDKWVIALVFADGSKKYVEGDWRLCLDAVSATKYDTEEWAKATARLWNSEAKPD